MRDVSLNYKEVALRKESVDRNCLSLIGVFDVSASLSARRAWIEIFGGAFARRLALSSLSARRAWIEIVQRSRPPSRAAVALRKESVDRNNNLWRRLRCNCRSLSARRAWIEISGVDFAEDWLNVALRKESVDRNCYLDNIEITEANRRSPQGERG